MSYSQAAQDVFALEVCKTKSYLDIGAWHPVMISNSYLLEQNGWSGTSIDISNQCSELYRELRKNEYLEMDALSYDFSQLPERVGYLSCDIEPELATFNALKLAIDSGTIFEAVTYEHDFFRWKDPSIMNQATEFMITRGYKVAIPDVSLLGSLKFETWFVHESIDFTQIDFDTWCKQRGFENNFFTKQPDVNLHKVKLWMDHFTNMTDEEKEYCRKRMLKALGR